MKAVYEAASGRKLESVTFGKPEKLTYAYADKLIKERALEVYGEASDLDVWMIGDNPASDIAGANAFGWKSALVSHLSLLDRLMIRDDVLILPICSLKQVYIEASNTVNLPLRPL